MAGEAADGGSGETLGTVADLVANAPAKVNLTLRVLARRADGYHDIESLVVFADLGDRLTLAPGPTLALDVRGPTALAGDVADNLVLKAARALEQRVSGLRHGCFALTKQLPVAGGLGGGSSDAAAALRLLAEVNAVGADDPRLLAAARVTGADVPVCLDPRPRLMRGIGDVLSPPIDLPNLPAVLANPGVAVATKDVFAILGRVPGERAMAPSIDPAAIPRQHHALVEFLAAETNDLEAPAIRLAPVIATTLDALRALPGCQLARMSGSGATCLALFDSRGAADDAARRLRVTRPGWWIEATVLGRAD